ncbi:MAG: RNA pseudouridine synthase [Candidatus Cloacimonetes bacterium]|nr:RNA pseudouridine synthase [Candidatus Cloacimonadota bacterium]
MRSEADQPVLLYEDNHCLVVLKPFNRLSQSDDTGDSNLLDELRAFIGVRHAKPGGVYLGLVHRLDRPAGGVMVVARTSKGASRLSAQFRERSVRKVYRVGVQGVLEPGLELRLEHWLRKDTARNRSQVRETAGAAGEGWLPARLSLRVLANDPERSELDVELETGRPHQIRAQLAAIGHPVLGDLRYGAREALPGRNIALWCRLLGFRQVVTGQWIESLALPRARDMGLTRLTPLP